MANLENYSRQSYNREDCNREISDLILILKKEIKLLRAGNFQNIERTSKLKAEKTKSLAALMAALMAKFDVINVSGGIADDNLQQYRQHLGPRLAQLKSLSIENGHLLRGVLNGVKSAGERIQALKNQTTNVGVYGRQGKALSFEEQAASNEITF